MKTKKKRHMSPSGRLIIILILASLVFVGCFVRAVFLIIENGDTYEKKALAQAVGTETTIVAKLGNILDANGTYLTACREVYRLILDPKVLHDTEDDFKGSFDATVKLLSEAFDVPEEEFVKAFKEDETKSYLRFPGVKVLEAEERKVYDDLLAAFNKKRKDEKKSRAPKIAGVWFETEYRREYPLKNVLSKVIGFTTPDATQGLLGLEARYHTELHGVNGKEYKYIAEDGSVTREVVEALDGYTIETSLDSNIAKIMQEEIAVFQEQYHAKRVNIAAMNPQNGEIYAMASDTDYDLTDPLDLSAFFTKEELEKPEETFLLKEAFKGRMDQLLDMTLEERLEALQQQVQLNYAVSGTYEPGSTAKVLTLATGYEENILKPDETFYCDGSIQIGRYCIHCHMDNFCGDLRPIEALGRSCNVCFVQMGQKIGVPVFTKYQEIFNLGQRTGIDLPGEANTASLIHTRDTMKDIEISTCSFGQGFNVTMVQLMAAYASILNGGNYYTPHVVRRMRDNAGNTVFEHENTVVRKTVSEATSAYLKEAMAYACEKGTGTIAKVEGYSMGGKTGAAEKLPRGGGNYVISFIGAAPIEDPILLLYVTVDEPDVEDQSMSSPAQELAHQCFARIFPILRIYPTTGDDPYTYDWSSLKDFSAGSDAQQGESFIDGDENIEWLPESETEANTEEFTSEEEESIFN